eukprot:4331331-Amphidinium_carterae.1
MLGKRCRYVDAAPDASAGKRLRHNLTDLFASGAISSSIALCQSLERCQGCRSGCLSLQCC